MARITKEDKALIERLSELGGTRFKEDGITYEGTRLVIPEGRSARWAIKELENHEEQMETVTAFQRRFRFRPWDGALAVTKALKELTGSTGIGRGTQSFFGSTPPSMIQISTGPNTQESVPWGNIEVGLFNGMMRLHAYSDEEFGPLFGIVIEAPRKFRGAVEGFFKLVQHYLENESLYRGKAFDGRDEPEFLDLTGINRDEVVYSDEVTGQLDANVWSMLRYTDAMRQARVPLKRAVLLHGPYGTGKTLAAFLTAQEAVANDWTFIYCRPARDDLATVMATARLYQPSVVFFEDVDVIAAGSEDDGVTKLLDTFDGITAKGTEILAVLTTNHPERIHKGMVRPGRLDAVIEIANLDHNGVKRLIRSLVPAEKIENVDLDAAASAFDGFLPAFAKEAIDRAKRYAIARTGELGNLATEDFVHAAEGLRPQLEMMESAGEGEKAITLDAAIERSIARTLDNAELIDVTDHDYRPYTMAVSPETRKLHEQR